MNSAPLNGSPENNLKSVIKDTQTQGLQKA
jgi:hypothetical protein